MRTRRPRVLLVERETEPARALAAALRGHPLQVSWVHDDEAAANALDAVRVDALIAPLKAPRIDGRALLRRVRARSLSACVVLHGDAGETEAGLAAMREGASDFLAEPVVAERVLAVLARGFDHQRVAEKLSQAEVRLEERFGLPQLAARSPAMRRVLDQIGQVAPTRVPVLLEGGPGSGKRLVAQSIHQSGPRRDQPFVWVACAALAPEEAERELFGQEQAPDEPPSLGRIERADGGTLYLGGVTALTPAAQAALLRTLHDGALVRVGGREPHRVDARIVAGAESDLAAEVAAGRFRADLFERLSVVRMRVPALAERREDLPLLAERLLAELNREHGRRVAGLTRGAFERLAAHAWPGNVRELRNALEAMVVFAEGRRPLAVSDLPAELRGGPSAARFEVGPGMTVDEVERRLVALTLSEAGHDKRRAAALLGIGLRTLYRKIREYGLS